MASAKTCSAVCLNESMQQCVWIVIGSFLRPVATKLWSPLLQLSMPLPKWTYWNSSICTSENLLDSIKNIMACWKVQSVQTDTLFVLNQLYKTFIRQFNFTLPICLPKKLENVTIYFCNFFSPQIQQQSKCCVENTRRLL